MGEVGVGGPGTRFAGGTVGPPPTYMRKGGRSLLVCSTLELTALAIWVGGLVVIVGAVIPAVFNTFGMEPGGRFLTKVFDGYNRLTVAAIVMLIGTGGWRIRLGRKGGAGGTRTGVGRSEAVLLTLMIAVAAAIILLLGPQTVALQERAFAAEGEAAKKTAYAAFFRSHTAVRGLYVVNLGLGITLLAVKAKQWMQSS
jgi:uncharacterized membrane protein